ncbi:LysM peptidoglycan-binding domain-containing protein [Geopsychrobacter electrodiphilus]|uniref:LysM peptidoglycan-binding domain-containing protein n=1 Tax=Geopsychrobacter electrodiphilus TaxID=225196 RepID=UPI00036A4E99|nr:LysM peptidoglycan-binding domain-containing protein [Geopsychrobacter electrodiphilus]
MNKQIRVLLLLLFLLIGLPSIAALAAESRTYTIKKGDTLWGISERFIKDPYYWPTLWAANPDITNPHLIYPGQKIRLYNGRIELIPEYSGAQKPKSEPAIEPPKPVVETPEPVAETSVVTPEPDKPVKFLKATTSGEGFILTDEKALGTLVDSVDGRVLLTRNDMVFLNMENPAQVVIGDTYSLFSRGPEIKHPVTKKPFGTMMYDLGFVQVTAINGNTVVGKIGDVYREIERGAELFEYVEPVHDIELKKANGDLHGVIVSGQQSKQTLAQDDIIYVDLGSKTGLQVGNILYVSRPRKPTALAGKEHKELQLPDALLGAALVIKTRDLSSAALLFKSTSEMHIGDHVMAASE